MEKKILEIEWHCQCITLIHTWSIPMQPMSILHILYCFAEMLCYSMNHCRQWYSQIQTKKNINRNNSKNFNATTEKEPMDEIPTKFFLFKTYRFTVCRIPNVTTWRPWQFTRKRCEEKSQWPRDYYIVIEVDIERD